MYRLIPQGGILAYCQVGQWCSFHLSASGQTCSAQFKPTLVQKDSRMEVYKALALQMFLYRKEICTLRKGDCEHCSSS